MSTFGDLIAGLRKAILIDDRVERLAREVRDLSDRERETRERLIYIEGILSTVGARTDRRRLPPR